VTSILTDRPAKDVDYMLQL